MLCFGILTSKAIKIMANLFSLLFAIEYYQAPFLYIFSLYIIFDGPNTSQCCKENDNSHENIQH